jgi:hypothetical protein
MLSAVSRVSYTTQAARSLPKSDAIICASTFCMHSQAAKQRMLLAAAVLLALCKQLDLSPKQCCEVCSTLSSWKPGVQSTVGRHAGSSLVPHGYIAAHAACLTQTHGGEAGRRAASSLLACRYLSTDNAMFQAHISVSMRQADVLQAVWWQLDTF